MTKWFVREWSLAAAEIIAIKKEIQSSLILGQHTRRPNAITLQPRRTYIKYTEMRYMEKTTFPPRSVGVCNKWCNFTQHRIFHYQRRYCQIDTRFIANSLTV